MCVFVASSTSAASVMLGSFRRPVRHPTEARHTASLRRRSRVPASTMPPCRTIAGSRRNPRRSSPPSRRISRPTAPRPTTRAVGSRRAGRRSSTRSPRRTTGSRTRGRRRGRSTRRSRVGTGHGRRRRRPVGRRRVPGVPVPRSLRVLLRRHLRVRVQRVVGEPGRAHAVRRGHRPDGAHVCSAANLDTWDRVWAIMISGFAMYLARGRW